jgi:putative tryptophan/tyrosine transport system substrate-binding protein
MRRRAFVALLGGALASPMIWPLVARAQQAVKVPQVVFFSPFATDDVRVQSFRQGLSDLGHVDGKDISVEYVVTPPDGVLRLAADIAARRPSAIVAATTPFALAVKRATKSIPIVAVGVADPVGTGLADSLARSGQNVISLGNLGADMTGKRLELLKDVVPGLARVAMLVNPDDPASVVQLVQARAVAPILGLDVRPVQARPADDLGRLVEATASGGVQALAVTQAFAFLNDRERIAALSIKHRLPGIFASREEVVAGGLLAYGADVRRVYRRAPHLLEKILKGASPADMPVEQPAVFELHVNLRTAKAIGLSVPEAVVLRATEVIE